MIRRVYAADAAGRQRRHIIDVYAAAALTLRRHDADDIASAITRAPFTMLLLMMLYATYCRASYAMPPLRHATPYDTPLHAITPLRYYFIAAFVVTHAITRCYVTR